MSAMTARSDIHRPSAPEFDPQDYSLVDVFDLQTPWGEGRTRTEAIARLTAQGIRPANVHPLGQCSHCGAYLRYTALMIHEPTNTYVWIGEQCLGNRFADMTKAGFQRLRKAAALHRDRMRKADRIAALVNTHPLLADLTYPQITEHYGDFIRDIAYRLTAQGELSDRQVAAVCKAVERENGWMIRDAQRAAERTAELASAQPAPLGRCQITGKVLSIKEVDGDWGVTLKMLVQAVEGYRVWVSVPREIDPDRGDWVRFTATLNPKKTAPGEEADPYFVIGTRPVKAEVIPEPTFK